ncbi:MAG: type IIL restriction-modification enzyme MmeI [Planctomycetales bacterium]
MTDDIVTDEPTLPQNFGPEPEQVARFIEHWAASGSAERANFPSFTHSLCDLLPVLHPEPTPPDVSENAYVFERDVTFQNLDGTASTGRIDLYKRGCFVLEANQGREQVEADDTVELKSSAAPKKKTKRGTAVRGTQWRRSLSEIVARRIEILPRFVEDQHFEELVRGDDFNT